MGSCNNLNKEYEICEIVKDIDKINKVCHSFLVRSIETKEGYAYKRINISDLNKKEKKKILNDIKILTKINHPNIISLKNAYYSKLEDKENKTLHVITEYADDGDLQMKLNEQKEKKEYFNEDLLLDWFTQVCLALNYIHEKNILHRDIKPSNIFLMKQNFAKLGDFKVAKSLESDLKYTKTQVATPQYLAPEIIENKEYSFKADIWSLGVTFYQLITLNYPFEGNTNEKIQNNILNNKKKEIPKDCPISKKFISLINEMLSKKPDDRPSSQYLLDSPTIKTRIDCYLKENEFNKSIAEETITKYEQEEKEKEKNKNITKKLFVNEKELKDIITSENFVINEDNKEEKAKYDLNRTMTIMSEQILKKAKTS